MTAQLTLLPKLVVPTGSIYYGLSPDVGLIKIGETGRSTRKRGGELGVEIVLRFDRHSDLDEKRHHRMWSKYRVDRSEWFRPAPELLLWLQMHVPPNTYAAQVMRRFVYKTMAHDEAA